MVIDYAHSCHYILWLVVGGTYFAMYFQVAKGEAKITRPKYQLRGFIGHPRQKSSSSSSILVAIVALIRRKVSGSTTSSDCCSSSSTH